MRWSERFAELKCEDCESTDVSCEKEENELNINCNNCSNNWNSLIDRVIGTTRDSEEPIVDLYHSELNFKENLTQLNR